VCVCVCVCAKKKKEMKILVIVLVLCTQILLSFTRESLEEKILRNKDIINYKNIISNHSHTLELTQLNSSK